jgi:hypothetical protein
LFVPADHGAYHYPRNHQDINYASYRRRVAGTVSHSKDFTYSAVPAPARGSTTAGTNGLSGGGGGIIIITDSIAGTVNKLATGGSGGSGSSTSGAIITILNT